MMKHVGVGLAAVLALVASACSADTPIDAALPPAPSATAPAATTSQVEPTAVPAAPVEPTAAVAEPTVDPADSSGTESVTPEEPLDFAVGALVAFSHDGVWAYGGTANVWDEGAPCDSAPVPALAVVNVEEAVAENAESYPAGISQPGTVRQLVFSDEASAVVVSACGPFESQTVWMQRVVFGANGRVAELGDKISLNGSEGGGDPFVQRFIGADAVAARVVIEVDPDDYESWIIEHREISLVDGTSTLLSSASILDDDAWFLPNELTVPDTGLTYREIEDPGGRLGCEGFGVARTIDVEVDGVRMPALPDALVFSSVENMHVAPGGYVAWTSGCEGFATAYVGKIQADGTIVDAHYINTYDPANEHFLEPQSYRLTNDEHIVGVGFSYGPETADGELGFVRFNLADDPYFVNSAVPPLNIDPIPLFDAIGDGESWHVGDTLNRTPACGASTLYGRSSTGFVRAFGATYEIPTIVDVDLAETRVQTFSEGPDFVSRTVVLSAECPTEYEGRRVYFGVESGPVQWGLPTQLADLGEVAEVLSVREQLEPGTDFVEASVVTVELLDGSTAELELDAVPFN